MKDFKLKEKKNGIKSSVNSIGTVGPTYGSGDGLHLFQWIWTWGHLFLNDRHEETKASMGWRGAKDPRTEAPTGQSATATWPNGIFNRLKCWINLECDGVSFVKYSHLASFFVF